MAARVAGVLALVAGGRRAVGLLRARAGQVEARAAEGVRGPVAEEGADEADGEEGGDLEEGADDWGGWGRVGFGSWGQGVGRRANPCIPHYTTLRTKPKPKQNKTKHAPRSTSS